MDGRNFSIFLNPKSIKKDRFAFKNRSCIAFFATDANVLISFLFICRKISAIIGRRRHRRRSVPPLQPPSHDDRRHLCDALVVSGAITAAAATPAVQRTGRPGGSEERAARNHRTVRPGRHVQAANVNARYPCARSQGRGAQQQQQFRSRVGREP